MSNVLVIGAGPAGLAAGLRCAESGRSVTIIDDNPTIGGQIWRGGPTRSKDRTASKWFERIRAAHNITFVNGRVISADPVTRQLSVETSEGAAVFTWRTLILATGARELFLPFPGWTLPGVTGVGGLQALAKSGLPLSKKRIVVAGSGPLLLAAAAYFKTHGAIVRIIAEQASRLNLIRFGTGLLRSPAKLFQAMKLRTLLHGVPYRPGTWVTRAEGTRSVERVTLTDGRHTWSETCDYLAVAYGLWPNTEIAALLGCQLSGYAVAVDHYGRTSMPNIFCAGEATGIGGLELSLLEGEIAGYSATGNPIAAEHLFQRRNTFLRFVRNLNRAFALRPEVKALSQGTTIVCRCEDVRFERIQQSSSWREAKLHTRCGMGPCQGRICGPALNILRGWQVSSVRPPIFPARIGTLLEQATLQEETIAPT